MSSKKTYSAHQTLLGTVLSGNLLLAAGLLVPWLENS